MGTRLFDLFKTIGYIESNSEVENDRFLRKAFARTHGFLIDHLIREPWGTRIW